MPKDKDGNNYVLPEYLRDCFAPTGTNSPFQDMYRVIVPSGQFWNGLTPTQKDEFRDIVTKRMKENPEDYIYKMKSMLPQSPKGVE